ncbi:FK506-binding protein 15 isoform X2 [Nomia melanderi]|uniref:FK506-binding protein 15 isoform X2 n=1 Tax=Nomia melanderi TaxID=2448451 RepID=UPI00130438B6|nr:FK506-binding protein 15 isoform X2 [Nomia melanderi]
MTMSSGNHLPNLDKIFRDEDEPDFLPSGGSNLAAIFGLQVKSSDNQSLLKQQISKKPSSLRDIQQTVPNKTEVIIAKAVHAFKLQNGAYVSVGKLGMALTGNITTKVYQIILYKTKQDHISTTTVTDNFLYLVQPNNYSSYYDNDKENWSILFENNDTCLEFAKEVGLARYFSTDGEIENVFYQDLSPMNKEVIAKEGDNLTIKYFIASEIVQPFKCNCTALQTMTVEISTDDNWEKTLLGSNKGLKRILFLPPSKQISLGPGFPKEKDVMLEIEITDIQSKKEVTQLHNVTSNKASIISRMAKMGQSMLPKIPVSHPTDSEDTEVESAKEGLEKKQSSKESVQETRNIHKGLKSKGDVPSTNGACKPLVPSSSFNQWPSTQIQPNFVTLDGQVYSLQRQNVTPTISSVIDPGLNMILSETRMTNTELRMGMSKIADNVQKLLDKFHVLELQNATSPIKDQTALDATLKMFLTMNAHQSGEKKDNYLQKSSDVTVTKTSTDLDEMRSKISVLKEKLEESKEVLTTKTECIKKLESQKESLIQTNENLNKKIQELEVSLKETNHVVDKTRRDLEEILKELNSKYIEEKTVLENKISKLVEQCDSLTSTKFMAIQDNNNKNRDVKNIMNKIYHTLMEKFVDEVYPTSYIKLTIASTIKNATLQILYNSDKGSNKEVESMPVKVTETDTLKITNTEAEDCVLSACPTQLSKQSYVTENTNMPSTLIQDEPPPISCTDDDWPD